MKNSNKSQNSGNIQGFTNNGAFYILKDNFSIIPNPVILNKFFSSIILNSNLFSDNKIRREVNNENEMERKNEKNNRNNKNDEIFSNILIDKDFLSVLIEMLMRNSIRIDWNFKEVENWNYVDDSTNLNEQDILSHLILNSHSMDNQQSNNISLIEHPFIEIGSLASYLILEQDPQSETSHFKGEFDNNSQYKSIQFKNAQFNIEQINEKSYIGKFLKYHKISEKFAEYFYPRYMNDADQIKKNRERFSKKILANHNNWAAKFSFFEDIGYSNEKNSIQGSMELAGVEKIGEGLGYFFFSHPHSDHYSNFSIYKDHPENSPLVIASRETIEIAKIRYNLSIPDWCLVEKGELNFGKGKYNFHITPSGHSIGSSSLIIENSESKEAELFFTSEFRPDMGQIGDHLDPRKCKILVTELTFTDPNIMFPPYNYEVRRMTDWIADSLQHGPVILYSYEYGKTQELSMLLRKSGIDEQYPIIFGSNSFKINEYCQSLGYPMAKQMMKSTGRKNKVQTDENFILIIPRSEKSSISTLNLKKKRNIKDAEISGWCAYPEWITENPADEHFIISDHADYQASVKFIKDCQPEKIFIRYSR